jgi:hypothetical protein
MRNYQVYAQVKTLNAQLKRLSATIVAHTTGKLPIQIKPNPDLPWRLRFDRSVSGRPDSGCNSAQCSSVHTRNELDRGGHFASLEVPDLFTEELRRCFRTMRTG